MAYTIKTKPLRDNTVVGQELMYTVDSSNAIDPTKYRFKYVFSPLVYDGTNIIGTVNMDITPNSAAAGIGDVSNVLEQYLSSDYLGNNKNSSSSSFKGTAFTISTPHPIHLIDKFSLSFNPMLHFTVIFSESYATTPNGNVTTYFGALTDDGRILNGMDYGNQANRVGLNYGIDLANWDNKKFLYDGFAYSSGLKVKFLSNSPDVQYIGTNDYHTTAFFAGRWAGHNQPAYMYSISFYDVNLNVLLNIYQNLSTGGGWDGTGAFAFQAPGKELQYMGCGVANLRGAGVTIPTNWDSYTVTLSDSSNQSFYEEKTFKRKDEDCKGFEKIRLTWINQYGVWDYYNFTKKNSRSTDIKREEYTQIKGNWNDDRYSQHGYQGGRTGLNTSPVKIINCNSDWFTSDAEAAWLEELFISNEVFILNKYDIGDTGVTGAEYGKYVIPVRVSSKKYERYTEANDKVAQYEIEIEYANNTRTQIG